MKSIVCLQFVARLIKWYKLAMARHPPLFQIGRLHCYARCQKVRIINHMMFFLRQRDSIIDIKALPPPTKISVEIPMGDELMTTYS